MPQLDFIIIFPQIFWLFIIFLICYILLLHYFIPNILISLKFRKKIVEENNQNTTIIFEKLMKNKKLIHKKLINNLEHSKSGFFFNLIKINFILNNQNFVNSEILNKSFIFSIFNLLIYCNKQILSSILIIPKFLNL